MSHGLLPCSGRTPQVLNIKKARRFRVGLVLYKSLAVIYMDVMYADNAGAVIGDLLYQPHPCG